MRGVVAEQVEGGRVGGGGGRAGGGREACRLRMVACVLSVSDVGQGQVM